MGLIHEKIQEPKNPVICTAPLIGQFHVQWQHLINTLLTELKELQNSNNITNLMIFHETKDRREKIYGCKDTKHMCLWPLVSQTGVMTKAGIRHHIQYCTVL
jgi:hypothetical protein